MENRNKHEADDRKSQTDYWKEQAEWWKEQSNFWMELSSFMRKEAEAKRDDIFKAEKQLIANQFQFINRLN